MDLTAPKHANRFRTPENWFLAADGRVASALFAASSDVTIVVDRAGVIQDIAVGNEDFYPLDLEALIGRRLVDAVAVDSKQKAALLLEEASSDARTRWREINLVIPSGSTIPLNFAAVRLSPEGDLIAFGRDLATVARLQQRVVDIQREMEADYARLRNAESRYRLLFQMAREPVLVVEAANGRIVEANPAAAKFLGTVSSRLIDRPFKDLFEPACLADVQNALMAARTMGRTQETALRLADQPSDVYLTASHYRQDSQQYLLVRLSPASRNESGVARTQSLSVEILRKFPEAFVATEMDGTIIEANAAFLDLVQLPSMEAARGANVDRWIGRPGIDLGLITSNLRDHGALRDFATVARGELGASEEIDVTAVYVPDSEAPCIGIVIRPVRRRSVVPVVREAGLSPTVENLTHLVGTMPLKDLVRETTDMIEQMCIEAALKLTDDNRASAAQILGLSRQSLYAKLHRFGMGDLSSDNSD